MFPFKLLVDSKTELHPNDICVQSKSLQFAMEEPISSSRYYLNQYWAFSGHIIQSILKEIADINFYILRLLSRRNKIFPDVVKPT